MNKQIEKLALECGAWHQVYGNKNFMLDEHFDIAKFSRLIVQECAAIVWNDKDSQRMLKHFGVEE